MSALLRYTQLQQVLPHRFPFLLVDCVTELDPGKRITGIKNLAPREPFLVSDATTRCPPSILIEALGQLAIVLYAKSVPSGPTTEYVLGSIAGVHLLRSVELGCQLRLQADVVRLLDNAVMFSGQVSVGADVVLRAENLLAMRMPSSEANSTAPHTNDTTKTSARPDTK